LWNRLVGATVLSASLANSGAGSAGTDSVEQVRTYAHCTPQTAAPPGSVTLIAINLNNTPITIHPSITATHATMYQLTPSVAPGISIESVTGVNGTAINLNGVPLVLLDGGALPELLPLGVVSADARVVLLAPYSITFVVFPHAKATACELA
jgi:hypothetical protein